MRRAFQQERVLWMKELLGGGRALPGGRAFHSLMVLSFVDSRNLLLLAPCLHHRILLIFSSISKLLR